MFRVKSARLCQTFMNQLQQRIPGVKCFFDSIIIHFPRTVTNTPNFKNCKFALSIFSTYHKCLDQHTIVMHFNKEKIQYLMNTERPKKTSELRIFLGMANYYNRFISNLATILNVLLIHGVQQCHWSAECVNSFKYVKSEILYERILIYFAPKTSYCTHGRFTQRPRRILSTTRWHRETDYSGMLLHSPPES